MHGSLERPIMVPERREWMIFSSTVRNHWVQSFVSKMWA